MRFCACFDHSCIPSGLFSASILGLGVIWDRGGGGTDYETVMERHAEFAIVCIVDLKAEIFQQQNKNTVHDFSAYGKTLEKNHSLMSRFSLMEERQRLQNNFSRYRNNYFRRNDLSVEWWWDLITACVQYPEKWCINVLSLFLNHKWNYYVLPFWVSESAI